LTHERERGAGVEDIGHVLGSYMLPTLLGNIIGGVTLVAALNHAQVVAGEAD
jgi:formate/nitrite transporter FocA (FNT family)